jgi:hypothetical protein
MKILIFLVSFCSTSTLLNAQLLKKLKAKVDQNILDVKAKVKEKAEKAPEKVIDHAGAKIDTKAESKIENKENKANSKVDKTVDKIDSIKIKKPSTKAAKDSMPGTALINYLHGHKILTENKSTVITQLFPISLTGMLALNNRKVNFI